MLRYTTDRASTWFVSRQDHDSKRQSNI